VPVTLDEILIHLKAVRRQCSALLVRYAYGSFTLARMMLSEMRCDS